MNFVVITVQMLLFETPYAETVRLDILSREEVATK